MEKRWLVVVSIVCVAATVGVAEAGNLRVMKTGVSDGRINGPSGISCGVLGTTASTSCNASGLTGMVTLTPEEGTNSDFVGWGGDCTTQATPATPLPSCTVDLTGATVLRSVRAHFKPTPDIRTISDFSPAGIETFLDANPDVNTSAEFIAALPEEFRRNWVLMVRSESLQTGTAKYPRILLASADATRVFTIALVTHSSYPGAHPNAIEYMQFVGGTDNNFHFHEIVLDDIPELLSPGTPTVIRHAARTRVPTAVAVDDKRCFNCHSTRNVLHRGGTTIESNTPGTTGIPRGTVKDKARPNWDTYDSWGGMLPFNRDRIYRNSLEAAAFRKMFNLWTWQNEPAVRAVIEQLVMQPDGVPANHAITRLEGSGAMDGHIRFGFDPSPTVIAPEPQPTGGTTSIDYNFDRHDGSGGTDVRREASDVFLTLHHACQPTSDEGRGVELFDRLSNGRPGSDDTSRPGCPAPTGPAAGAPNPLRIASELSDLEISPTQIIRGHPVATGNVPIDVRPITLAVLRNCYPITGGTNVDNNQSLDTLPGEIREFLDLRNGLDFNEVYDDTRRRAQSLPRRKADVERTTLDRDADLYVYDPAPFTAPPIGDTSDRVDGMIREYGAGTLGILGGTGGGTDQTVGRVRQEVFRRVPPPGHPDETVMRGQYIDREDDSTLEDSDGDGTLERVTPDNTADIARLRYFLEPLGVSVDKWSMGVRGRSRTYTFADVWYVSYPQTLRRELARNLGITDDLDCTVVRRRTEEEFARLLGPDAASRLRAAELTPTYTDLQRIFNKACIECHGGLGYPPYHTYGDDFDLTEDDNPATGQRRLWRSLNAVRARTAMPVCDASVPTCPLGTGQTVTNSRIYRRITDGGNLAHPFRPIGNFNLANPDMATTTAPIQPIDPADERCPGGLMPCEGPPLSKADIETVRRWIVGDRPNTEGDPHIRTVDGIHYDFQSAGEFVLLRSEGLELQARQTPVTTAGPVGPDGYTGLTSCVSINTAVAIRVGLNRITYQPQVVAAPGVEGDKPRVQRRLRLRVDGKDVDLGADGFVLSSGGRIMRTSVAEGIEIHVPGGEGIVITPWFWDYYQVWYMNIEVRHARATEGVMGAINGGSWLPALSNGDRLGAKPADLGLVYRDLHETFAKSWRVDATTSLFDYEPGQTPDTFFVEKWPGSGAQQCVAPPLPGGPIDRPAPPPVARAEAEQLCAGLVDAERRENCIADVMAMGEPSVAKAYAATEALERRTMPGPAELLFPADNARVAGSKPIEFRWRTRPGAEVIDVVYRHCLWNSNESFDFERCVKLPGGGAASAGTLIDRLKHRFGSLLWLILLVLLILVLLLIVRFRLKGVLAALALAAVVLGVLLLLARARATPAGPKTSHVASVTPGKEYSWVVIAETRDGIFVETETYRLEVTP